MRGSNRFTKCFAIYMILSGLTLTGGESGAKIPVEIKELFHTAHSITKDHAGERESPIKGFSEGGTHYVKSNSTTDHKPQISTKNAEESKPIKQPEESHSTDGMKHLDSSNSKSVNNTKGNEELNTTKKFDHTLLTQTENSEKINLLLSIQGGDDSNTSSIKPRKGVDLNDMPPKITETENELEKSLPLNKSCDLSNNNRCFNITECPHLKCYCCNDGKNYVGFMIGQQSHVNCSSCQQISNICCLNNTQVINANKNTHDVLNSSVPNGNYSHAHLLKLANVTNKDIKPGSELSNNSKEDKLNSSIADKIKTVHHKPLYTKVPCDSDTLEASTYKPKKEIIIPIIVSCLTVPLIAVLLIFVCRRTRDFYNKRQYKRMDYLIDGIYND